MRALLFGAAFLILASAGPVTAYQPNEQQPPTEGSQPTEPGPRGGERPATSTPRPDRQAGGRCRSSAGDKATAEAYCERQLNCAGQGLTIKCNDAPNNYACKCV